MKHIIGIIFSAASASLIFASEESAVDVAKRVIADHSSAYTPRPVAPMGVVPKPPARNPEDVQLDLAAEKAREAIRSYMLSGDVPEKTRIAYAIIVLASKRIPKPFGLAFAFGGSVDVAKNDQYLHDGLVLATRMAEIQKSGRPSDGAPH